MSMNPYAHVAARLAFGLAAALPIAAQAQTFAVKPGAWEMTSTMRGNAIPPAALAKMTPERRASVEKMLADNGGADGQSRTRKSCVKKEDLDRDDFGRTQQRGDCTTKATSRSATKLVIATTCSGPPPLTGTMTFEAKTPESVVGSIDQQRPDGSTFHVGIVGKWLAASCDGIEPSSRKQ